MPSIVAADAVARIAARDAARTEADLQADVYLLLTAGGLNLNDSQVARLEVGTGDGTRRRLDVEIGHCVIELKRDLRTQGVRPDAEAQLAGYVETQTERLGTRYVGILTDGTDWYLYRLDRDRLVQVSELHLAPAAPDADSLLVWLEAILATQEAVKPSPLEIERRLGADSPAHSLDHGTLRSLYEQTSHAPEVSLKRDLWAKLLRTAFGKAFDDDESLFIDHTLLVLTAEIIAHAVIGFDVSRTGTLSPEALVRGTAFTSAQIQGVVEADFFDWVLHAPGGANFVVDLADRVARFDWSHVEHDVLKLLYESVIAQEARASLGEYYTPDWLADRIVNECVSDPLMQRVLDPACGSGTFIFHAARVFLVAAEAAGMPNGDAVRALTNHVFGMDVHPVAVTLARVTYLLAVGSTRLTASDRGPITVPIYLGDSLQWEQQPDLFGGGDVVTISTAGDDLVQGGGGALFGDDLVFPRSVLSDAARFDQLVTAMADKATDTTEKPNRDLMRPIIRQFAINDEDATILTATFDTMRRLHGSGKDHIWGYYVRNLIRPLWLADSENRLDVLIGNPPWLRYSKMLALMQERYKTLAKQRGLLSGPLGASGRDLSTLFVARAVQLYLKPQGRFGFVMPHGTMTRKPHEGFRSGNWSSRDGGDLKVTFTKPWDLSAAPTGFPMVSCVVFGTRSETAVRLPTEVQLWSSALRSPAGSWEALKGRFTLSEGRVHALGAGDVLPESPYRRRFRQGAVLAPRALLFAVEGSAGPLGAGAGRVVVDSRRTTAEKRPWKDLPSIHATVERAFLRPVHLGETLLPFRLLEPLHAVLPVEVSGILTKAAIENHSGLAEWWATAENRWTNNKVEGDDSDLLDRIDFHGQLSSQFPSAPHRVMYSKAGNRIAAARIADASAVIDHKLYWAPTSGEAEAKYLVAILNSQVVLDRVKPLQALGLFGTRDFDKTVFHVPIPTYDPSNRAHSALVALANEAEALARSVDLGSTSDFKRARTLIRDALAESGLATGIEAAVAAVVPEVGPLAAG